MMKLPMMGVIRGKGELMVPSGLGPYEESRVDPWLRCSLLVRRAGKIFIQFDLCP